MRISIKHVIMCLSSIIVLINNGYATGCPLTHLNGFILSGRVVAALRDGIVPLAQDDDYYCFNYSLAYQVSRPPEVAVSVHDFEVEAAKNLYFYIKPIKSDSYSFIPFVIRTQWAYTSWNQISFSFIVQDRTDIESGYFQIDTGLLSSCLIQKNTTLLLPFRTFSNLRSQIKHLLFLHGFQITTVNKQNYRTPIQIQLVNSFINNTGINVTLLVKTQTKVDSVFISYVAIQQIGMFRYQMGNYVYQTGFQGKQGQSIGQGIFAYTPQNTIGRNFARIFGINGFIMGNSENKISYNTVWDSFTFRFQFKYNFAQLQYFSFSYLFFLGSECDNCPGYPYTNQDKCMESCPINSVVTSENFCMNCGAGKVWNGTNCIITCPKGQFLNYDKNICECPLSLNWDGSNCIPCLDGKIFNQKSLSCECPNNLKWNGFACVVMPACTDGKIWDVFTYSCVCPQAKYWNGITCSPFPTCMGGQTLNRQFQCVCLQGYHWNGQVCSYSPCLGGKIWTGSDCVCPIGLNFNGTMCIQCINGQKWNRLSSSCQCDAGYKWNGMYCQKSQLCAGNLIWNQTYQQCICAVGYYWSGYKCLPILSCSKGQYFDIISLKCICNSDYKWDGRTCINCKNGKIWNITSLTCKCPIGTIQSQNGCIYQQKCTGGKIWVLSLKSCQCPSASYWNGDFCIKNPCQNGKIWNQQYSSCQCPNNNVYINNTCLPPRIACTNGKVWNPLIYACQCPLNTFQGTTQCSPIRKCITGRIYNPMTNQCNCAYGLVQNYNQCINPSCQQNQIYNGFRCEVIKCAPPSYFSKNRCVIGLPSENCGFSQYWNGQRCVYYSQKCPGNSSIWSQKSLNCIPSTSCSPGYYKNYNKQCLPYPQKCIPPLVWNGKMCSLSSSQSSLQNTCANGTFWIRNKCIPYNNCKNGATWDSTYMRCGCPLGSFSNSQKCIQCGPNKIWRNGIGCVCTDGYFNTGSQCLQIKQSRCQSIINSLWINKKCVCRPGFTKINMQCICMGTQIGTFCDHCSYKPNSQYIHQSNSCNCKKGYIQINKLCYNINQRSIKGQDNSDNCTVATYYNSINKLCLPCSIGCLSCIQTYKCTICRPQFYFDTVTQQCIQYCGDGRKFTYQCDDGNNNDGDGCSKDCKIQNGYLCSGGSPQYRDNCYINNPQQVKIQLIGQIRKQSSITLNIKLNYIPKLLLYSSQCSTSCNVLNVTLTDGDISIVSIQSYYITGTKYLFNVFIQFGRPYIGKFNVNIGISQIQSIRYFGKVYTGNMLKFQVNPAYLALINQDILQ